MVEWEPPSHLGYVILSGMPVRNYRADIRLTEVGDGNRSERPQTLIEWSGAFDPKFPGSGRLVCAVIQAIITRFAERLARHAAKVSS